MTDIEEYLNRVCRDLSAPAALRKHLREELRNHIEEAIAEYQASGVPPEEAARRAIEGFGDSATVRDELEGVYGKRLVSLLIDRAMVWKARTMTTEWKWSFAGQFALLLIAGLQVLLISAIAVLVLPIVVERYVDMRVTAPGYLTRMIDVLRFLAQSWYVWAVLVLVAMVVFERRAPKGGKSVMRLGAGAWAVFALTLAACAVIASTTLPLAQAARGSSGEHIESTILAAAEKASALHARLPREQAAPDRARLSKTVIELHAELRFLCRCAPAAPFLTGLDRRDDIDEVRRLLVRAETLAGDIAESALSAEPGIVREQLADLDATFTKLTETVAGWPSADAPE